jgi:hypothetical protein
MRLAGTTPKNATGKERTTLSVGPISAKDSAVSDKHQANMTNQPPSRRDEGAARPVSNRGVAIFFAMLVTALVLGYLLLNKLVDMSQEEDCALGHRYNCGAQVAPGR